MSDYRLVYQCKLCQRTWRTKMNEQQGEEDYSMETVFCMRLSDSSNNIHKCSTFSYGIGKLVGIEFGVENA